jgi:hypothetical protein
MFSGSETVVGYKVPSDKLVKVFQEWQVKITNLIKLLAEILPVDSITTIIDVRIALCKIVTFF